MNRFKKLSTAARLAAMFLSVLFLGTLTARPVGAQDASPVVQVSVVAPSVTPEVLVQVESAEQAEVLVVNGVTVLSTDPEIDESGWIQCRQVGGSQLACQTRVEKKLGRLGFDVPNWTDPDGAVQYMSGLRYENRPDKPVISDCTRQMSAWWDKGTCWVHPATPTPPATSTPTETPEPPTSTPTATNTSTPEPTATGTQLPTATATATSTSLPTATSTSMPTATATTPATVQSPTVTPTRGDPWVGHTLTLGSFCSPTGAQDSPVGQAPGEPLRAYIGAYTGTTNSTSGDWWGGDTSPTTGWTQTTQLSYGQSPRVWSYATSVTTPLVGWYFVDPATGLVAERAQEPEVGFRMGGTRDSKWLASLHDCEPVLVELQEATPVPTPAGEQPADLRRNGGGPIDPRGVALGVLVFIAGGLTALIILVLAAMVAAKRREAAQQEEE